MSARDCRRIEPLLDELLDGELDEARARAVHAHLRACAACAGRMEASRRILEAARELEPLEPPASLWAGIDARLAEAEAAETRHSRLWWWWQAWRRPVLASALVATAAAAVFLTLWRRTPLDAAAPAPPGRPPAVAEGATQPAPEVAPPPLDLYTEALREVERADADYRGAIAELRAAVAEEQPRWRPEVRHAFADNLAIIEAAVLRQREVARRAPADPEAQQALYASYRKEIDFLQEAVVRGEVD